MSLSTRSKASNQGKASDDKSTEDPYAREYRTTKRGPRKASKAATTKDRAPRKTRKKGVKTKAKESATVNCSVVSKEQPLEKVVPQKKAPLTKGEALTAKTSEQPTEKPFISMVDKQEERKMPGIAAETNPKPERPTLDSKSQGYFSEQPKSVSVQSTGRKMIVNPYLNDKTSKDSQAVKLPPASRIKVADDADEFVKRSGIGEMSNSWSANEISRFIKFDNEMYGTKQETLRIKQMSGSSSKNELQKAKSMNQFFAALHAHHILCDLAVMVHHEGMDEEEEAIYEYLRGKKTPGKWTLLNAAMIVFGKTMIKEAYRHLDLEDMSPEMFAKAQYQATSVSKFYKNVFCELKHKGVTYEQKEFVNRKGSYFAYWKRLFGEASKYRHDLGRRPNAVTFDPNEADKIQAVQPPLKPYTEYNDLIQLLTYYLFRIFLLRSTKEPHEVTFSHFKWSVVAEGKFKGRRRVQLAGLTNDKTHKISLVNPYVRQTDSNYYVENPASHLDFIKLVKFYEARHFKPGYCGKFLCKKAAGKVIAARKAAGNYSEAGDPFGLNHFNQTMKTFARRCGFENADKYTGRSGRVAGITDLVSSKENIASNILLDVSRHTSEVTNSMYQRPNQDQHDKRITAVHNSLTPSTNVAATKVSETTETVGFGPGAAAIPPSCVPSSAPKQDPRLADILHQESSGKTGAINVVTATKKKRPKKKSRQKHLRIKRASRPSYWAPMPPAFPPTYDHQPVYGGQPPIYAGHPPVYAGQMTYPHQAPMTYPQAPMVHFLSYAHQPAPPGSSPVFLPPPPNGDVKFSNSTSTTSCIKAAKNSIMWKGQ